MYKSIPVLEEPTWTLCSRCGGSLISMFSINHEHDICDYLHFINMEASKLGYARLNDTIKDTYYIKTVLEHLNVPHRSFHVHGISGHYHDIFLPDHIATLINIYYTKEGYADMPLEEYIVAISS